MARSQVHTYGYGSHWPHDIVRSWGFKLHNFRQNPAYFWPDGLWIFCGPQGCGKTLSLVQCAMRMAAEYPQAILLSNLCIKPLQDRIVPLERYEQIGETTNGVLGVIVVIDEIHLLYNSLESKNVPISEMATMSQLRKERRVILGTSQVYMRMAKPLREQCKYIIDCHSMLGALQVNHVLDPQSGTEEGGRVVCDTLGTQIWMHRPELYDAYDTFTRIDRRAVTRG